MEATMRKLLTFLIALGAIVFAVVGPVSANGVLFLAQSPAFTPGCSQSSTFLARTTGLSTTERNAYDTMICGMVTDGTWGKLDVLYIFATNNQTTANLNLVSTSFTGTTIGSPSFSADHGYTGGSFTAINSGLQPSTSSGNFSQNSASIGFYDLTSRTTANSSLQMGANTGNGTQMASESTGNAVLYDVNDAHFPTVANANAQGFYVASRTASTTIAAYRNGASLASSSGASGSPSTDTIYFLARNASGTVNSGTTDQLSAGFIGGGLSSTDVTNISNDINGYMRALGINVY